MVAAAVFAFDSVGFPPGTLARPARLTLNFGFLLLEAYLFGVLFRAVGLPKISGYIVAGILFGPHGLGVIGEAWVKPMKLVDDLALTIIALAAGAELALERLRPRLREVASVLGATVVLAIPAILGFLMVGGRDLFPFLPEDWGGRVGAALVMAVIATGRSPTAAIALIRECRAKGPFTDLSFTVTIAMDTVVILLFAAAVAVAGGLATGGGVQLGFLALVAAQIAASVVLGVLLGWVLSKALGRMTVELPTMLIVFAFFLVEFAGWFSHQFQALFGLPFHLEALLIAISAGFFVRNASPHGARLHGGIQAISLPIFAVFFAMTGVHLDVSLVARLWLPALLFVVARMVVLGGATFAGAVWHTGAPRAGLLGMTFLTQAGVSLGLAQEMVRRFPGWAEVGTFLVACITVNEVVGPILFKYALDRSGESGGEP
ncbi:MAG: cation:proton antiporter [Deferrisoma sp.]